MPVSGLCEYINPCLAIVPILCPLKTPENLRIFGVFGGYKMGAFARNGLKHTAISSVSD